MKRSYFIAVFIDNERLEITECLLKCTYTYLLFHFIHAPLLRASKETVHNYQSSKATAQGVENG